jgi:hypothetical protein
MHTSERLSQSSARVSATFQKLDRVLPQVHQASAHSAKMRMHMLNPQMSAKLGAAPMTVSPSAQKRKAQSTVQAQTSAPAQATPTKRAKRKPKLISAEQMARIDGYGKQYTGAQDFVARTPARNQPQGMTL